MRRLLVLRSAMPAEIDGCHVFVPAPAERGAMHGQCADGVVVVPECFHLVLPVCECPRACLRRDPVQAIDALAGVCCVHVCVVLGLCLAFLQLVVVVVVDQYD